MDMFSAKLIQKKVDKATRGSASKNTTAKRKWKDDKTAPNSITTKKKLRSSVKTITPDEVTAETDINKNKVSHRLRTPTRHTPLKTKDTKIEKVSHPAHENKDTKIGVSRPSRTNTKGTAHKNKETKITKKVSHPTHTNGTVHKNKETKKKKKRKLNKTKTTKTINCEVVPNTPDNLPCSSLLQQADWGSGQIYQWHDSEPDGIVTPPLESPENTPNTAMAHRRDSERTHGRKQRRNSQSKNDHTEEIDASLIGECLSVTKTERGSVVAALVPETTLYLQGCVIVCPVLGHAEVLGYTLHEGQSQPLYSLPSCSLLGVTAIEGLEVDPALTSLQGLPPLWLKELAQRHTRVMLLEVKRHTSPRVEFLASAGWGLLTGYRDWQKPWHSIGASIVTRGNRHKDRLTHVLPEWKKAAQTVVMNWNCGAVPRVMICGGKGVGKSTFFKYLANTLLSAQPDSGILCLDLDPGQPELSLSTSLSITRLTKPLLGPAFTHNLNDLSLCRKHILVGAVSPQFVLEEYIAAVRELIREAGVMGDMPLLVNTMGWTQGTGLGLMLDVLRLVLPTHVMQIQSHRDSRNYPFHLDGAAVSGARGGITTQAGGWDLHYALTILPSAGQAGSAPHMAQPKVLREMRVLAEAGQAAEHGHRITVPWAKVALHVCQEQVPRDRILQVLNAQLVALCRVDPSNLHTLHPDLPQLLVHNAGFGDLLGWGVVMGIDPLTTDLHLATTMTPQQVSEQVNAIVMPRIHLPASFYKLFCIGQGPYLEEGNREGGARLRVGRKIKPRGMKD